ncbi:hypothetical protein DPMN_031593 [Dreissena polymorpha]|uniref:Uncharacterized protein n=1 Tax=Dreissena polymorpha TaxID=45954 RepID=A0A9D4M096_DREPO|nr:hypothetical protein DPMN_031593 [Dreissena polymorpha]
MVVFALQKEDEVWSDIEVYLTFTQEELVGPMIATQPKDNDSDTTESEDILLADLVRKKKQPVKGNVSKVIVNQIMMIVLTMKIIILTKMRSIQLIQNSMLRG